MKPKPAFTKTAIEDLIRFRPYQGEVKTIEEMNEAVREAIPNRWAK